MPRHLVGFRWKTISFQMKGSAVSARSDLRREISSPRVLQPWVLDPLSLQVSHFKVLLPSLHIQNTACNFPLLIWTGHKAEQFPLSWWGMLPSVTLFSMDLTNVFSPMLSFIHYTDCVHPLLFLFTLENSLFSIMQTATCDLLTTRQVRSCVLAPKTHPACSLLTTAHLNTTDTVLQMPSTHPSTSCVWAGFRANPEWHPT